MARRLPAECHEPFHYSAEMRRLAVLVIIVVVMAACSSGDDGGSSSADGASGSDAPSTTEGSAATALELTSTAFGEGEAIPVEYAGCDGANESPPLEWTGGPDDADQMAVTLVDPDAGDFVHWVMVGIDPQTTSLETGEVPPGAVD